MKSRFVDKYYEEYFINDTKLKKLYNLYVHQSFFDKVLDILVFFAILFSMVGLVLEFLIGVNKEVLTFIHEFSAIIVFIFALEIFREYIKSKSFRHFLKKHWVDFTLIVILSFYFMFAGYFGFARIKMIEIIKSLTEELKHIKVTFNFFKR